MDVTKLPFNEFIGLSLSSDPNYLLMLDNRPEYRNHLDTVHASAQFALAEATSGKFLLGEFEALQGIIPVVRKVEIKYKRPSTGKVFSKARFQGTDRKTILAALEEKKRVLLQVEVTLYDESGQLVMQAGFEWFVTKQG